MANTKNRAKSQTKKPQIETLVPILIGAVVILMAMVGCLVWRLDNQSPHKAYTAAEKVGNGFVSLGSIGFKLEGDKMVARHDSSVEQIRDFLKKDVEQSGCENNDGATTVLAHSQDEKQLLLGYGCGSTTARMFAVKKADGWKAILPTNQFNTFNIPSCKMTDENNISKEIAPVCQNENKDGERSVYEYKLR